MTKQKPSFAKQTPDYKTTITAERVTLTFEASRTINTISDDLETAMT